MPAAAADIPLQVLVRGAGPVGCAAALALRDAGFTAAIVDSPLPPPAFRPIALSHASRLILERLGAWEGLQATPITIPHFGKDLLVRQNTRL